MADDDRRGFAQSFDEADDVAREMQAGIGGDVVGLGRASVAPLVRRDHAITGFSDCCDLMAPGIPGLRKAMAEHDQRALPRFDIVHADAVGLDEPVLPLLAHAFSPLENGTRFRAGRMVPLSYRISSRRRWSRPSASGTASSCSRHLSSLSE